MNQSLTFPQAIMTIAGSDCSAGAGMQADLKSFQHFGLHGLTAVTGIVSETSNIVRKIEAVSPEMVRDQVTLMLDSFHLPIVKTGMLGSASHVITIAEIFEGNPETKLVIDPVMVASTGASLIEEEAIIAYQERLLPISYLITPNLPEAERLLGRKIASLEEMHPAAQALHRKFNCAILLKGGHLGSDTCTDILSTADGISSYSSPRLSTAASHGTGCTLAAAIAANLALGNDLPTSVQTAKDYLNRCLAESYSFIHEALAPVHMLNQGTRFS